ncbi:hypothetical protein PR048_016366 [Dryococelus australis]|uniref:P/Homo B domain-containing protein n=1 Tax=Dryococelus australis TaxID=614101 RepID=A0ABQ9HJI4_9NEOP|nr:hypothetical protein PR048_016366 [Dryococelus australis]
MALVSRSRIHVLLPDGVLPDCKHSDFEREAGLHESSTSKGIGHGLYEGTIPAFVRAYLGKLPLNQNQDCGTREPNPVPLGGLENGKDFRRNYVRYHFIPAPSACWHRTNATLQHGELLTARFPTSGCEGSAQELTSLEHVQVTVEIHYPVRGVLQIHLTSPAGECATPCPVPPHPLEGAGPTSLQPGDNIHWKSVDKLLPTGESSKITGNSRLNLATELNWEQETYCSLSPLPTSDTQSTLKPTVRRDNISSKPKSYTNDYETCRLTRSVTSSAARGAVTLRTTPSAHDAAEHYTVLCTVPAAVICALVMCAHHEQGACGGTEWSLVTSDGVLRCAEYQYTSWSPPPDKPEHFSITNTIVLLHNGGNDCMAQLYGEVKGNVRASVRWVPAWQQPHHQTFTSVTQRLRETGTFKARDFEKYATSVHHAFCLIYTTCRRKLAGEMCLPTKNIARGELFSTVSIADYLVRWSANAIATPMSTCSMPCTHRSNIDTLMLATNLRGPIRSNIIIFSTGTKIQLLSPRKLDKSDYGFQQWTFMSVLTWGEDPRGVWQLQIVDEVS